MAIDTNVTAPVNVTGAPVTNTIANHAEKPDKFNGHNFKRWQQKMFFYLTTLNLAQFLNETAPQEEPPTEGQPSNAQAVQAVEAWKHSDFLCHNYVLNGMVDSLYNVYCKTTTAKELWESLVRKYKTEDAGTKKFVVACFLDYKMVDSKNVITQVQDLQVLLHEIHAGGMTVSEAFQVAAIIEKLPPSWVDFKNYLKHKRKETSVKDLIHVGSSLKSNSKAKGKGKKKNDKKGKGKAEYLAPKAGIVKQKFQGTCYNCDQPGHHAANCKMPKRVNPRQANMVNDNMDMIAMVSDVIAMISKVNLVAVDNGEKLYMGNSTTADIKGEGDVILKMTFEKELKLTNLAVPTPKAQKIGPKSVDCIFIGYAKNSSAYHFIVHDSKNPDKQKNAVIESRNASFFENIFPCLSKETGSSSRLDDEVVQDKRQQDDNDLHDEKQDQLEEEEVEPRRSKRARTEKSFGPDFVSFMVENEPTSYREAVTSSEGHQWKEAIKSEIDSILQNHTWELVDLPPGYRQREGLDYFDSYSPVTRITSIRMVLAIVALRNLEVHQMDVKTAFLNGDLEEEIYMNQHEGFIAPG
ncbi:pol polyprotein [Tanacetum coccineum]